MADPIAFKQALTQCEAEQIRFSEQIKDICLTVKAELNLKPQVGYPSFDEIATRLNMSSRTLRRHLNQVGSSYLQLLEEAQQKKQSICYFIVIWIYKKLRFIWAIYNLQISHELLRNGQVKHPLHLERINNVDLTKYILLSCYFYV